MVQGFVEVTLIQATATATIDKNVIHLPQNLKCPLQQECCNDDQSRKYFWKVVTEDTDNSLFSLRIIKQTPGAWIVTGRFKNRFSRTKNFFRNRAFCRFLFTVRRCRIRALIKNAPVLQVASSVPVRHSGKVRGLD